MLYIVYIKYKGKDHSLSSGVDINDSILLMVK